MRVFKTKWFTKAAYKAQISDKELCLAIIEIIAGRANDLGGSVFKKRLSKNRYRSIILAKNGEFWFYAYLFAKNERQNIDNNELQGFRKLARAYEAFTDQQLVALLSSRDMMEICHDA